jgi:cysteine desulfuration protein SufE
MLEFQNLFEELFELEDPMDKYEFIMDYGNTASSIQEFEKNSKDLVKGCTSSLWLNYNDSQFTCQADSAIVKGLAGMICDWYNQATNTQRQSFSINTLNDIGLAPLLSMGRQNGVNNLIATMKVLETGEA